MKRRRWATVRVYLMRPDQHAEYLRRRERITSRPYTLQELHRAARLAGGITVGDPDAWQTEIREGNLRVVALPVPATVRPIRRQRWDWGMALGIGICVVAAAYVAWHVVRWWAL